MQLSNDEIARFRSQDEFVISNGCYISPDNLLTARPFIYDDMNKNSIKLANCTFSELVLLAFGGSANSLFALYDRLESIEFSYNQKLHIVTTELNLIKAIKAIQ